MSGLVALALRTYKNTLNNKSPQSDFIFPHARQVHAESTSLSQQESLSSNLFYLSAIQFSLLMENLRRKSDFMYFLDNVTCASYHIK
jgi:hypothetical protein